MGSRSTKAWNLILKEGEGEFSMALKGMRRNGWARRFGRLLNREQEMKEKVHLAVASPSNEETSLTMPFEVFSKLIP